tara:strand:- start:15 stop:398 length:384 start_codon:yes stop_codon:yes gene_type:complete
MKPDIVDALVALKPGAIWTLPNNPTATNDYERLVWQDESQTKPTEDEVNTKVTELVNAYPMKLLREERTRRIATSDWMANSDVTMSDEWKTYRQALRDLPSKSGISPKLNSNDDLDISSIIWPTPPS